MIRWLLCLMCLVLVTCGSASAQCPSGVCGGGITFRSPVVFRSGYSMPPVRYSAGPVWTTVRVYDPLPPAVTYLPPVEVVEALPPVVEYVEPVRTVQRVRRVIEAAPETRTIRRSRRPLVFRSQSRWSWPGDLREHMRRSHGLSAATVAELSDSDLIAIHDAHHEAE